MKQTLEVLRDLTRGNACEGEGVERNPRGNFSPQCQCDTLEGREERRSIGGEGLRTSHCASLTEADKEHPGGVNY